MNDNNSITANFDQGVWTNLADELGADALPRLLALYQVELAALNTALQAAAADGDYTSLKDHTHKSKNSAALFGALDLAAASSALDAELAAQPVPQQATLAECCTLADSCLSALALYLNAFHDQQPNQP